MIKFNNFTKLFIAAILMSFLSIPNLYAQYCDASTSIEDEYISRVEFGDIDKSSGWQGGVADYTNESTDMVEGRSYSIEVTNGNAWSADRVKVWIDWNHNEEFETTEEWELTSNDGGEYFTGTLTIPENGTAVGGETRMRVRMTYSSEPQACGSSSFGEVEDYSVNIILPIVDAGVESLIAPPNPVALGIPHSVGFELMSYSEYDDLESVTIHWYVNSELQGTIDWTGFLGEGESEEVELGEVTLDYSERDGNSPYIIRVVLENPNGANEDADFNNNDRIFEMRPPINDAGISAFTRPSGTIVPDTYEIWVELNNYGAAPLTEVTIDWSVDGISQESVEWEGEIGYFGSEEVLLGEFPISIKSPLEAFVFEATTVNPNGEEDEIPGNDKAISNIGPSLTAGTFTIGGSEATFPDFETASAYLTGSGIATDGTCEFLINPGTYDGRVMLDDFSYQNNDFIFRSATGDPEDVVIHYTPTNTANYILYVNNIDNITFQDLTFEVDDDSEGFGGILWAENVDGILLDNVTFIGSQSEGDQEDNIIASFIGSSDIHVENCTFEFGTGAIYASMSDLSGLTIEDNSFSKVNGEAGNHGSIIELGTDTYVSDLMISNNMFTNSDNVSGITLINVNNAKVSDNLILLDNSGSSDIAGIRAMELLMMEPENDEPSEDATVIDISFNEIDVEGMPALALNDQYFEVYKNEINVMADPGMGYAAIEAENTTGYVAQNMIMGNDVHGIKTYSDDGTAYIYNSVQVIYPQGYAFYQDLGNAIVWRNIFVNEDSNGWAVGTKSVNPGAFNANENVYYTTGEVLGSYNGNLASNITEWQAASGQDAMSADIDPMFDVTGLFLTQYDSRLLSTYPIPLDLTADQRDRFENEDWNGENRAQQQTYYAGIDNIQPEVVIEAQPQEVIGCIGSDGLTFGISAFTTLGAETTYQWYKDGVMIEGANEALYHLADLDYNMSGLYHCLVSGTGGATPVPSEMAALYVLQGPEIDDQPVTAEVELGSTATFTVSAHIRHLPPGWKYDYQWYFWNGTDDVELMDNGKIEGAKSSQLTVNNITANDITDTEYYYCVVSGKCGQVTSAQVGIQEFQIPEDFGLEILEQPELSGVVCENGALNLNVEAQPLGTSTDVTYQWYKDGAMLTDDGRITGATTDALMISELTDADDGSYYVIVTELPGNNTLQSNSVFAVVEPNTELISLAYPESVKEGEPMEIFWEVNGADPVTITIELAGTVVAESSDLFGEYIVDQMAESNAGDYTFTLSSACGDDIVENFSVVLEDGGIVSSVPVQMGVNKLHNPLPNPVNTTGQIFFELREAGHANLQIVDQSGATVATLVDEFRNQGLQSIQINADALNLSSGMYFLVFKTGRYVGFSKLSIVK